MTTKLAIAGCGRIAYLLENDKLRYKPCTHLGAIIALKRKYKTELVACYDPELDRAEALADFAKNHKMTVQDQPATKNIDALFEKKPELLVISSTTRAHFDTLQRAVESGIKKIVIEKPVCITADEANQLKELAKKSRLKIWVNYERRYHEKYVNLKSMIANEKLGKCIHYRATFSSNARQLQPNKKYEGVLLHDTTHMLDLVYFLFGTQRSERIELLNSRVHKIHLEHKNATGEILTMTECEYFQFELEIQFSKGRIRVGNGFYFEEHSKDSPHYENFRSLELVKSVKERKQTKSANPFLTLYGEVLSGQQQRKQHFIDACENVITLTK